MKKFVYSEIFKFWKFSVRNCGLVMNSQVIMRNEGVLVECSEHITIGAYTVSIRNKT